MMSQKQRLIQLTLPATVLLGLLVGVALIARRRFAKPASASPATIVQHSVSNSPEETLKYWTTDKMNDAKPVELPNVKALKQKKKHAHKSHKKHS